MDRKSLVGWGERREDSKLMGGTVDRLEETGCKMLILGVVAISPFLCCIVNARYNP